MSKSLSSVTSAVAPTPEVDDTTPIVIDPLVVTVRVYVVPREHVALAVPETVNLAEICLPLTMVPATSAVEHSPTNLLMSKGMPVACPVVVPSGEMSACATARLVAITTMIAVLASAAVESALRFGFIDRTVAAV